MIGQLSQQEKRMVEIGKHNPAVHIRTSWFCAVGWDPCVLHPERLTRARSD